jgi:hypothetical protein
VNTGREGQQQKLKSMMESEDGNVYESREEEWKEMRR